MNTLKTDSISLIMLFLIGFCGSSIVSRICTNKTDDIVYPAAVLVISVICLVLNGLPERK